MPFTLRLAPVTVDSCRSLLLFSHHSSVIYNTRKGPHTTTCPPYVVYLTSKPPEVSTCRRVGGGGLTARSSSEQARTGLQSWPPNVTSNTIHIFILFIDTSIMLNTPKIIRYFGSHICRQSLVMICK